MQCKVTGCSHPKEGRSHYCLSHKKNKARHGHAEQASVSSHELATYLKTVRARIAKNISSPTWAKLDKHWSAVVRIAQNHVEASLTGEPQTRYQGEAWADLARLGQSIEPRAVVEVALAVYLMQDWYPNRFKDDAAFGFQLVRRVRSLDSVAVGTSYDHKLGKAKKVYRDMKPRTTAVLAGILQQAFGVAGLTVAKLEAQERQQQESAREEFHNDLAELT
jgi:hypothetical protein